ncbi:MAG: hypothetical protein ABI837_09560, partial [Acidobacteriota bacterium]
GISRTVGLDDTDTKTAFSEVSSRLIDQFGSVRYPENAIAEGCSTGAYLGCCSGLPTCGRPNNKHASVLRRGGAQEFETTNLVGPQLVHSIPRAAKILATISSFVSPI